MEKHAPGSELVSSWLREISQHWQTHPRWKDLCVVADEQAVLKTNRPLLAQVLNNLIENAFKYSPTGTSVIVSVRSTGKTITFAVRDHGPGISSEEQYMIFDPFYRSASARRLGVTGVGLGLAVAARIVQTLGGRITVESQPDDVTTFRIELPISR